MADDRQFPLNRFPKKLMRSLIKFAAVGTLMAGAVWWDGDFGPWIPLALLVFSWATPAIFAYQIHSQGFDPLTRLDATEAGLMAHYQDGNVRMVPWRSIQRLLQIEGFRHRSWAVITDHEPLRWFGELKSPEAFAEEAAARTGLAWEVVPAMPEPTT